MSKVGGRGSGIGDRGLDIAIDRAVREMLDVEPPPGLRGRVLDRIEYNSAASAFGLSTNSLSTNSRSTNAVVSAFRRKIVWVGAPLAAAAILVLAVLAPWRPAAPPVATSAPPAIAKVEPPPVVAPPASPKIPESSRTTTTSIARSSSRPRAERPSPGGIDTGLVIAAVAAGADGRTVIDPLTAIAPIVAAGIYPENIAPIDIVISAMAPIAQLQIAPLSPPERRN